MTPRSEAFRFASSCVRLHSLLRPISAHMRLPSHSSAAKWCACRCSLGGGHDPSVAARSAAEDAVRWALPLAVVVYRIIIAAQARPCTHVHALDGRLPRTPDTARSAVRLHRAHCDSPCGLPRRASKTCGTRVPCRCAVTPHIGPPPLTYWHAVGADRLVREASPRGEAAMHPLKWGDLGAGASDGEGEDRRLWRSNFEGGGVSKPRVERTGGRARQRVWANRTE